MLNNILYDTINNINFDDPEYKLEYPFDAALKSGDKIDYKLVKGSPVTDHSIVKKLGYEMKCGSDCSCYVTEIPWFSFSSYGDWGTVFTDDTTDFGRKLFLYMCHEKIIEPWRIRSYVRRGEDTISYTYDDCKKKWKAYASHEIGWKHTEPPEHYI